MVEIFDMATLRLSVLLTALICVLALVTVWRIDRSLPGILQMMLGLVLNLFAFLIGLASSVGLVSAPFSLFLTNILSLTAITVLLEGILRFRGFASERRWLLMFVLVPFFALIAWINLDNSIRRYLFHDGIAIVVLVASAVAMVWKTRSRDEFTTYGVASFFSLLMAGGFAARWLTAAGAGDGTDFALATALLYTGILMYMVGLSFAIVAACYFKSHQNVLMLAREDALTGLPNRRSIDMALGQYLNQAQRQGVPFAIVVMDLDRFKQVNDSLGHSAGDKFLVEVAARIRQFIRKGDFAGRLGGDEFLLILQDISSMSVARSTVERFRQSVEGEVSVIGHPLTIQLSLGIACWPESSAESSEDVIEQLLRLADQNMYLEKIGRHQNVLV